MKKHFRKRSGTTDLGKDYEILNIANIVIDLVRDGDIKDFQISSNDEEFGDFDDIVVETELAESTEIIAIQSKHCDRGNLYLKQFTPAQGNFSLKKYFSSWQTVKVANVKFILFTNLKYNFQDGIKFNLDGENFPITLTKVDSNSSFKISPKTAHCYKFSIVKDDSFETSDKILLYEKFFENFYLYSDQENVDKLKQQVYENFKTSFSSNVMDCDQYVKFLNEWGLLKDRKQKLNKKWMKQVIALKVFSSRLKPMCFDGFRDAKVVKGNILCEAIDSFKITIFTKESYDELKNLWGDAKSKLTDLKALNKLRVEYQISPIYFSDVDKIDSLTLNILLWLMGKCPLIITPDESVYKILALCAGQKCILLEDACRSLFTENIPAFRTLSDLKINKNEYDQLIKHFTCSLQGKQEISLEKLIAVDESFLTLLKTDDLLEIVKDQLNIGDVKEELADPYVERCLFKKAIDIKVLDNIAEGTAVILDCVSEKNKLQQKLNSYNVINVDDYLNAQNDEQMKDFSPSKPIVCLSEEQCHNREFNSVLNKSESLQHLHQFRVRNDGNLEWIRSKGDVSGLEKYKLSEYYYPVQERDLSASEFQNNVNLLISDPGMGKSELMRSFKIKCSPECFTLIINPGDVYFFLKNTRDGNYVDDFKNFLLNEKCKMFSRRDKYFFEIFFEKNKIVFLWDAMDELSEKHRGVVCDIIIKFSENCPQWVTSRHQLQDMLQQKFSSLSLHLVKFNEQEQRNYIEKRLSEVNPVEKIDTILEKIKSSFVIAEQENILGVPLQLFMLTELFRKDKKKYLALLDKFFPLTDLYHYFIQEKMHILYKDKMRLDLNTAIAEMLIQNQNEKLLEEYTNAALRLLFPKAILTELKVQCKQSSKVVDESFTNMGLVTEVRDQIPRFIHNSFAEYLAASYFESKIKEEQRRGEQSTFEHKNLLLEIMFDPKYVNVKFFFDLLLAGDSRGHIAVLYKDFSFIKDCTEDEILTRTDCGGKSVLHLACSWGPACRQLDVTRDGDDYIVNAWGLFASAAKDNYYPEAIDRLTGTCDVGKCDEVFKMTPGEYARKAQCTVAEMKLILKQDTGNSIEVDQLINILYLSAYFGFGDEFEFFFETFQRNFVENNERKFDNILNLSGNTLLHVAAIMGQVKILEFFNKAGANINLKAEYGVTPVHAASGSGRYGAVKYLSKIGADVSLSNRGGITPLNEASRNGHFNIVEYLVSVGTDINLADEDGNTPLHSASLVGSYDIVKFLVEKGADFNLTNKDGSTPLDLASWNGHFEVVEYLVSVGTDGNLADEEGDTSLHLASSGGFYDIVKLLVENGADFNLPNRNGCTPLNFAYQNGHFKIVEYLVSLGTDVNLADEDGNLPLHTASIDGSYDIVKIFVEKGVCVNLASKNGSTPLNIASLYGHFEIVEYLVNTGADTNLPDEDGNTPLHSASTDGFYEIFKFLVDNGACVNPVNKNGSTPLHFASRNEHTKILEYLVNLGTDINLADENGNTPLHLASSEGSYDTVKFLVEEHANINQPNNKGDTPLHSASSSFCGSLDIVKCLVEKDADFNLPNIVGSTPLNLATRNGKLEIVEYLVSLGTDVNLADEDGTTPLHSAASKGSYPIVKLLVEKDARFNLTNKDTSTPLNLASRDGHFEIVEYLVSAGTDINLADENGDTPLHSASNKGSYDTVKLLVKKGAGLNLVNKSSSTPLDLACRHGHVKIVEYLVNVGTDINLADKDGNTPLHSASSEGTYDIVKFLVGKGARFNLVNKNGCTPLNLASWNGHFEIVEYLVSVGTDINLADEDGDTPLHSASFKGSYDIAKLLVENGARFNVVNKKGSTPLNSASWNGHFEIVEYLVNLGADVNPANERGTTPLHWASLRGSYKIVKLLVEKGAGFNVVNRSGDTPLNLASLNRNFQTVEYLVNLGTDINHPNSDGDTPLHSASSSTWESYDIVKFLVESGADINLVNNDGNTPLNLASGNGHLKIVEYFVNLGAKI